MILLELFWSFFQVGLFSFGGGMAAIPLIQYQIVEVHQWLTLSEFTDLITISEMTPGPIAINSATFVGSRVAGFSGSIVATLGCVLPSCIIVSLLAWLYHKYSKLPVIQGFLAGLRPAVVALISSVGVGFFILAIWGEAGFSLNYQSINYIAVVLFCVAVFVLRKWKPNPIFVMMGSGVVGGLIYLLT